MSDDRDKVLHDLNPELVQKLSKAIGTDWELIIQHIPNSLKK